MGELVAVANSLTMSRFIRGMDAMYGRWFFFDRLAVHRETQREKSSRPTTKRGL